MTLSNFIPTGSNHSNLIYRSHPIAHNYFTTSVYNCPFTGNIQLRDSSGEAQDPYLSTDDDGHIILKASDLKKNEDENQLYVAILIGTKNDGKKDEI